MLIAQKGTASTGVPGSGDEALEVIGRLALILGRGTAVAHILNSLVRQQGKANCMQERGCEYALAAGICHKEP